MDNKDNQIQDLSYENIKFREHIERQDKEIRRLQDELQRFKYRPTKEQAEKLGIIPKP